MDIIQGFIQPPKVQSAEETIPTLCDRVENATLISDRRSAVLGLKAFSREYRESVVASGLKPLINTLKRDYVDENSVKAILETLLILFIRGDGDDDLTRSWISQQSRLQNGKYPSPLVMKQERQQADQFSLWIADAITQSDELVHLLIHQLETGNFHIRLYTIQLLEAVVAARPLRSRSAITSLPTGVSTLVSLLDDIHEPIRDEAILLLMAVVNESSHVQVLVAFENIFERLFSIIDEEGGLRGSIVVNDCLSLVHNILKYNISNQTLFLETGNLPKLAQVLNEPLSGEEFFWNEQRIVNINTALDIVSLTVDPGSSTTTRNQTILLESNVLMIVLRLAFHYDIPKTVRPVALLSAADMIRGNDAAQTGFSKIDVPYFDPSLSSSSSPNQLVPIVCLLLNWTLYSISVHIFSLRVAAVELLKSYLHDNGEIQVNFLSQQIGSYNRKEPDSLKSNLIEAILDYDLDLKLNPYKLFFATDLLMYLFESDVTETNDLREMIRNVTTGSGLDEEESLSSIQALSELIITSLTTEDIRIPISYITFLIFWIYGDRSAVNDFLMNREVIQSLLSYSYQVEGDDITVKCLVTMLLGVSYEFSSKTSPFPRKPYFEYITKTLGKDNYLSRISQFKSDSMFSKAPKEINLNPTFDDTGLPQVYFSPYFVSFFTENYYRIKTALLHSCEEESYTKISYETFEELQGQCHLLKENLKKIESERSVSLSSLEKKLQSLAEEHNGLIKSHDELQHIHTKLNEHVSKITQELKETTASLTSAVDEKNKLLSEKKGNLKELDNMNQTNAENMERIQSLEHQFKHVTVAKEKAEEGINKMNRELMALTRSKGDIESKLKEIQKKNNKLTDEFKRKEKSLEALVTQRDKNLASLKSELSQAQEKFTKLNSEKNALMTESNEWKSKFQSHENLLPKLTEKLKLITESCKQSQNERDTLSRLLKEVKSQSADELAAARSGFESVSVEKVQLASENKKLLEDLTVLQERYGILSDTHEIQTCDLKAQVDKLNKSVRDFELQVQHIKSDKDEAVKIAADLRIKCDSHEEDIKNQRLANEKANAQLAALREDLEVSKKKLATAIKEKLELSASSVLHGKEAEKLREDLQNKTQSLEILSGRIAELEGEMKEKEKEFITLEKNLRENLSTLEAGRVQALSGFRDLQNELAQSKNDTETVKKQNSTKVQDLENRISALQKKLDDSLKKIEEFDIKLDEKVKSIEKLRTVKEDDDTKIRILQEQLDSISCEKDKLFAEKSDFQEEINELRERLGRKDSELEEIQKSREELKEAEGKALQDLQESQKISRYELEGKQRMIQDLEVAEKKVSSELSKLQKSSDKGKEELAELRNELKEKAQEFEKERKLLNEGSDSVTRQYSEKISELEGRIQQMGLELQSTVNEIENSRTAADESTSEFQTSLAEKASEITSLKSEVDQQKKKTETAESNLQNLTEENDEKIAELKKRVETLKEDVVSKERQIDLDRKDLIVHGEKSRSFERDISQLTLKLDANSEELKKLTADKHSLEGRLATTMEEKDNFFKKFEEYNVKYDKLQKKFEEKSSQLKDLEVERKAKENVERTVEEKNQKIIELEAKVAGIEDLRKELGETLSKVAKLEAQEKSSKEKLERVINEKDENASKLTRKSNTVRDLEYELEQKSRELEKLTVKKESMIEHLEKDLKEKHEKLSELEAEKANLSKSNEDLKFVIENHSANNNNTAHENKELKIEVEILQKDLISLQKTLNEADGSVSKYKKQTSSLEEQKESLNIKTAGLSKQLQALTASVEKDRADFDDKKRQMMNENESLRSGLEKLRLQISESKRENRESQQSNPTCDGNSEVEDLMLLVSELDERNTKYKAKLRDLGVELSSDEEEDDDDDEENGNK